MIFVPVVRFRRHFACAKRIPPGLCMKRRGSIAASIIACGLAGACTPAWSENPDGVLDQLSKRGITPKVVYDGDAFANLGGGVQRGTTYEGNLHLQVFLDGGRLFNWAETTAYINGIVIRGGQPSAFSGDAQGVSNIAAPPDIKLEEAWLQRNFFAGRFSVLAGRYDLNSEFYRLNSAGLFLNSSFGVGPEFSQSGLAGPSIFPNTAIGARIAFKPAPNVVLRTAIMDGAPYDRPDGSRGAFRGGDGLLVAAEAAFLTRPAPDAPPTTRRFRIGRGSGLPPYDTKFAVGGWHYTATFNDLFDVNSIGQPVQRHGSSGVYLLVDRPLFQVQAHPEQQLAAFLQLGVGDGRVNRFGSYAGAGLVASGLIPNRPADELGLAIANARNGSHYINNQLQQGIPVQTSEIAVEFTYLTQINKWLAMQPNFQYVIHPNTDPSINSARTFQLRFELAF
jgi:porin